MSSGKYEDAPWVAGRKIFTRGWRQAIYFPFGENFPEKIYMPGNLNEEIHLWLGEHSHKGRDRPKSDFLFLSGLKAIFEILFQNHEPFYSSSNGVVMAFCDQKDPDSSARIIFPVPDSRPQEYELTKSQIAEAIRIMDGLEKIRRENSSDATEGVTTGAKTIVPQTEALKESITEEEKPEILNGENPEGHGSDPQANSHGSKSWPSDSDNK